MTRKRLRQLAAIGLLALLSASAGCTGMFGVGPGGQGLSVNSSTVEYDWNTSADVTLNISNDQYRSVYNITKRQLEVYTLGSLASEQPLDTAALKYRYPNGTVITLDASDSDSFYTKKSQKRTTIHVPAPKGEVAFITSKSGKSISKPVFVDTEKRNRSYEIVLPPNTGASIPLLSNIRPSGYETTEVNNRVHITWDSIESQNISVRYYLHRDLLIFGGIAAVLAVAGLFGAGYYLVQIRKLTRLRKEIGLDIETEDDG